MTTTNKKGSQQFKKYVVFTLMAAVCAAAIWFIFAPSDADKAKQEQGLNSELPDPRKDGIISDKRDAYEQESLRQKQQERMRSLQEYDFSSAENTPDYNDERYVKMAPVPVDYDGGENRPPPLCPTKLHQRLCVGLPRPEPLARLFLRNPERGQRERGADAKGRAVAGTAR